MSRSFSRATAAARSWPAIMRRSAAGEPNEFSAVLSMPRAYHRFLDSGNPFRDSAGAAAQRCQPLCAALMKVSNTHQGHTQSRPVNIRAREGRAVTLA
jgi:hypothetical protein